jgi:SAM-dependent methyltransferase
VRGPVSTGYELADDGGDPHGWSDAAIAERQHLAYADLLRDLRRGTPRNDLRVAANAVRAFGIAAPSVVEIGCGSGYYAEVFERLAAPVRYAGVDFSMSMLALARRHYSNHAFVAGDAAALPLATGCVDIGFSGNSLMHIDRWREAVRETARIARRGCVFHSVPILERRATTRLRKRAYGVEVVEILFNRGELEAEFARSGLVVRDVAETIPYDLRAVVGEPTRLLTFVCEKQSTASAS